MNTKLTHIRFSLSMTLSLLFHLIALLVLQYLVKTQPSTQHANSVSMRVQLIRPSPVAKKILTSNPLHTDTNSSYKISTPAPTQSTQKNIEKATADELQNEHVTGVAMPSGTISPFGGISSVNNGFFGRTNQQTYPQQTYQDQAMAMQAKQQAAQQTQVLKMQLMDILGKQLNDQPEIEGTCILDNTRVRFQCDNTILGEKVSGINTIIQNIYNAMSRNGGEYSGFYFNNHDNRQTLILLNHDNFAPTH